MLLNVQIVFTSRRTTVCESRVSPPSMQVATSLSSLPGEIHTRRRTAALANRPFRDWVLSFRPHDAPPQLLPSWSRRRGSAGAHGVRVRRDLHDDRQLARSAYSRRRVLVGA